MSHALFVVGMHRSGTSTVTGLLHLMGAYVGEEADLIGANAENPKGFWERRDVIEWNDALLMQTFCRWHNLAHWPQAPLPALGKNAKDARTAIWNTMNAHPIWALKDPRLCHTLPYWMEGEAKPLVILVLRSPLSVARSLEKRNGLPTAMGLALWEACSLQMLEHSRRTPFISLHYEALVQSPATETKRLYDALCSKGISGLHMPSTQDITSFIDPSLNRSGKKDETQNPESSSPLSLFQTQILELLSRLDAAPAPPLEELQLSREAKALMIASNSIITLHTRFEQLEEEHNRALQTISEHEARLKHAIDAELELEALKAEYSKTMQHLHDVEVETNHLRSEASRLRFELDTIKSTRIWKLRCALRGDT